MWEDKIQVQTGNAGETIIDRYIRSKNLMPYKAVFEGSHPFDRIIASTDKQNLYIADAKTKARRTYYPDTGINYKHYQEYKHLMNKYSMRVFLFFVDEWQQKVYGNFLDVLEKPVQISHNGKIYEYPLTQGIVIYFPLELMRDICNLDKTECELLKQLSSRNYEYPQGVT